MGVAAARATKNLFELEREIAQQQCVLLLPAHIYAPTLDGPFRERRTGRRAWRGNSEERRGVTCDVQQDDQQEQPDSPVPATRRCVVRVPVDVSAERRRGYLALVAGAA